MQSQQSVYRLYVPSQQSIFFCRTGDFTPLKEEKKLPSVSSLLEDISRRIALNEEAKGEEA